MLACTPQPQPADVVHAFTATGAHAFLTHNSCNVHNAHRIIHTFQSPCTNTDSSSVLFLKHNSPRVMPNFQNIIALPLTNVGPTALCNRVPTLLLTKNSRTFPGHPQHFPWLFCNPAMSIYTDKQQLLALYTQCNSTIQCKTFINETVRLIT